MRLIIIDDHELFGGGLEQLLLADDPSLNIVRVISLDAGIAAITEQEPFDLVLLDLHIPPSTGPDTLNSLMQSFPALPVVILTASDSFQDMEACMKLGAMGYITKAIPPDQMLHALREIWAGKSFISSGLKASNFAAPKESNEFESSLERYNLTPRHKQIVRLIVEGDSNKDIANKLYIAEGTVKIHVSALLKNLGIDRRTQIASRLMTH